MIFYIHQPIFDEDGYFLEDEVEAYQNELMKRFHQSPEGQAIFTNDEGPDWADMFVDVLMRRLGAGAFEAFQRFGDGGQFHALIVGFGDRAAEFAFDHLAVDLGADKGGPRAGTGIRAASAIGVDRDLLSRGGFPAPTDTKIFDRYAV